MVIGNTADFTSLQFSCLCAISYVASQVVTRLRSDPGDAEETRHCRHSVDCVALDTAHHCLAPERHHSTPCYSKGYDVYTDA